MEQLTRNPLQMEMEQTEHESKVNDKTEFNLLSSGSNETGIV